MRLQEPPTMNSKLLLPVAAAALMAVVTPAQSSPKTRLLKEVDVLDGFVGLDRHDGNLLGFGNGYSAEFLSDGVAYTPVLGPDEIVDRTMRFSLMSVGRGRDVRLVDLPTGRDVGDLAVRFRRPGVEEVYEVRNEGLKQSFVFETAPQGSGDLFVRVRVEGDVPAASQTEERITFRGDQGEVVIHEVIGFDAAGTRTRGSMSFCDGVLEMRLPGAFVADAVPPITLDPLIGTIRTPSSTGAPHPDAAYDATNDVFLMVWQQTPFQNRVDIYGQLIDTSGNLVGSGIPIRVGRRAKKPQVANVNARDCFVVCWEEEPNPIPNTTRDVFACTVAADDGSVGTEVRMATSFDDHAPAIGGNRDPVDATVCIGHTEPTLDQTVLSYIACYTWWVETNGDLTFQNYAKVARSEAETCSVSDAPAGDTSFWIAFSYLYAGATPGANSPRSIGASWRSKTLSNRLGVGTENFLAVANADDVSPLQRLTGPSISGDSDEWVIAYASRLAGQSSSRDIYAATMSLSDRNSTIDLWTSRAPISTATNRDESNVRTAWARDSLLACHVDGNTSGTLDDGRIWSGSQLTCFECADDIALPNAGKVNRIRVATQTDTAGSTDAGENALIVWQVDGSSTDSVKAQILQIVDGVADDLGGACGVGSDTRVYASCPIIGNPAFVMGLRNAPKNRSVAMLLGPDPFDSGCGGCRLYVDPFTAVGIPLTTDASGSTGAFIIGIPDEPVLQGLELYNQWLIGGESSCAALGVAFTDAIRIELQ